MARAAKAAPKKARPKNTATAPAAKPRSTPAARPAHWDGLTVTLTQDGAVSDRDLERLSLMMADGIEPAAAWSALGKANNGTPGMKRRGAEKDAVFIARVATLREEKAALDAADSTWGPVEWKANQLWRHAAASGDIKAMGEAAKLAYQVANAKAGGSGGGRAASSDEDLPEGERRGVGKPAKANPQSTRDATGLRNLLLTIGDAAATRERAEGSDEDDDDSEIDED